MLMELRFEAPERFETAADRLHELVARETGCTDFGPTDYRMGLRVLLQSMDYDPHFNEGGRRLAWGTLISALSARARAIRSMNENPGFDRTVVDRPVVITGIPRTGTTALHKLMAVDPRFQGLQAWIIGAPMPRPPRETWDANPFFQAAIESLKVRFATTPDLRAAHNMVADEVDECLGVMCHSFVSNLWACNWSSATYDAWWQSQSEAPAYAYLRRVLQLIGGLEPEKRWLLKNPGHIANLDLLFDVFPDAMVIHTHRDPAKAVPSLGAILTQLYSVVEGDARRTGSASRMAFDHLAVSRWPSTWVCSSRRAHAAQVLDVVHGDFHRDPLGTIRRIYGFLNLELTPPVEAAMRSRIAAAPELSHGTHRYDVADFGLTEEEIRESFGDYVDRFDLVPGPTARRKGTA
jgi:hypothetical protein